MAVISTKPDVKLLWAAQGTRAQPTSDKQLEGWVQEIPPHEIDNWKQYVQDLAIKYIFQEGFAEWDSSFEYNTTSYVKYNGVVYKLKSGAEVPNIGKQPDVETLSWERAFEEYGSSIPNREEIEKIKTEEGYLGLYVSKSEPVMDGIATAPEFQATSGGGHTFQGAGADTGLFLNGNNEPEIKINNVTRATIKNSPTLTSNDTTVVTTAMLRQFEISMQEKLMPIGISIITQDTRNPVEYLGFGSWQRDLEGRALVGYSSDVTSATPDWKKTVNSKYGSDDQTLTVEQIPSHTHSARQNGDANNVVPPADGQALSSTSNTSATSKLAAANSIGEAGGGQPHSVVQMSQVKIIFTRVA